MNRTPRSASAGHPFKMNNENKTPSQACPPRRKSARLSAPEQKTMPGPVEAPPVEVKRSITVRKIAPRKTQVPLEANKENVERLSGLTEKKPKVSTPAAASAPKPTILSPILAPVSPPPQPQEDSQESVWSQKVRRSYSCLSTGDQSIVSPQHNNKTSFSPSPSRRETLFGFATLQTPEVIRKADQSRVLAPQASSSLCGDSLDLSEVEDGTAHDPEPDMNIPGVAMVKKSTRRKRVKPFKLPELDFLSAQMNAEFEEAEGFELVVE